MGALADDHEDPGADDGPDAQRSQGESTDGPLEFFAFAVRLRDQIRDITGDEKILELIRRLQELGQTLGVRPVRPVRGCVGAWARSQIASETGWRNGRTLYR